MIGYKESTYKKGSRLYHDSISNLFEDQNTWQVLNVARFLSSDLFDFRVIFKCLFI